MARVCQVTGKRPMVGNNVSHANNKTKRRFLPNLQYRRFWLETENRWVRLRVSNAALRLIDKVGIDQVVADLRAKGEIEQGDVGQPAVNFVTLAPGGERRQRQHGQRPGETPPGLPPASGVKQPFESVGVLAESDQRMGMAHFAQQPIQQDPGDGGQRQP